MAPSTRLRSIGLRNFPIQWFGTTSIEVMGCSRGRRASSGGAHRASMSTWNGGIAYRIRSCTAFRAFGHV